MKIQTSVFSENEDQMAIPLELFRMKEWSLGTIASIMQMFAIDELELTITNDNYFPVVTPSVGYAEADGMPALLEAERPNIVRTLQQLMMSFGYKRIEAHPTEEEILKTKQYWAFVNDGTVDNSADPVPAASQHVLEPTDTPSGLISEADEQQ